MSSTLHLSRDPKLAPIIKQHGELKLVRKRNVFINLISSIMSQQLSTNVARIIYDRFIELAGANPTPARVLSLRIEQLRAIGLSNAKAAYIHNVAHFAIDSGLDTRSLARMDNDEVIAYLTQIKGVGRWTVEMELMFTLGREDVFPIDDLGIQQAIVMLYKLRQKDKKKLRARMIQIAQAWAPYRTYASMYLWRYKDQQKKNK